MIAIMATAMWVKVFIYQEFFSKLFSHFYLLALYDIWIQDNVLLCIEMRLFHTGGDFPPFFFIMEYSGLWRGKKKYNFWWVWCLIACYRLLSPDMSCS